MTEPEKTLLENVLDALDRLFDRNSSVIDVWALLYATREALRGTTHFQAIEEPTAELRSIVRSRESADEKHRRALAVTDELRHYLARLLPFP